MQSLLGRRMPSAAAVGGAPSSSPATLAAVPLAACSRSCGVAVTAAATPCPAAVASTSARQQPQHQGRPASRGCVAARGQASSSLSLPLELDLEAPLPGFDSIKDALADLAAGKMVVALDDEDRENEGDLIMNADKVTTEAMAFIVEHTSGVVCIAMEGQDLDRLRLPLMVSSAENEEAMYTAFTVTVDLKDGISTGISAADRTLTIRHLANPAATPAEFRRPGHIFPLRYRPGGVLVRPGHTEASVDLARLSGSFPAGVLCEIVNKDDGSMARTPQLLEFAKRHGLKCITIADLLRYRLRREALVTAVGPAATVSTRQGAALRVQSFRSAIDGTEHLAFVHGTVAGPAPVLLHVHHERTVADLLHMGESGGGALTLDVALQSTAQSTGGVLLYMRTQASQGTQPSQELAAMQQHLGSNGSGNGAHTHPVELDLKTMATAAQMLRSLGVRAVRLAGSDDALATALRSCGIAVHVLPMSVPLPGSHDYAAKPMAGATGR